MTWPQSTPIYVPAGAWIRQRSLPAPTRRSIRPHVEPEWLGLWHAATGDVSMFHGFDGSGRRRALARCGARVAASVDRRCTDGLPITDSIVSDERPTVDLCSRCLRLTGDTSAADFVAAARRRRPVVLG